MASSVSVYLQGNDALGTLFGNTSRLNTAVYTLPATVAPLSTAIQRSSSALLVIENGQTTKASPSQIAATLDKLATKKDPVVAYLGTGKKTVFLNAAAVALVKNEIVAEPVAVPTRTGDDVPGEETFSPSPIASREIPLAAKALAAVDIQGQLDQLIASGAIKSIDAGTIFLEEQPVPAPAQLAEYDYKNLMVSSPVSDGFQGSPLASEPAAAASRDIAYYNPGIESVQITTTSSTTPIVITGDGVQTQSQSVVNSWWLWLIIVIILVVLLIVSVVLYYRR